MSTEASHRRPNAALAVHLDSLTLVDHHVHAPLIADTLGRDEFEQMITESDRPAPAGTTQFDSQIGVAIRRHCAPLLGLPAAASAEDYWEARRQRSALELAAVFCEHAGVDHWFVDTGFGGDVLMSVDDMNTALTGHAREIVRLETVLESVAPGSSAHGLHDVFRAAIDALAPTTLGWKSVIAYRHGFDFDPAPPTTDEIVAAADRWLRDIDKGVTPRVTDPVLLRMALWAATETAKPLQLHAGYGDPDLDLHRCDPLLLTDWLRKVEHSGAPVMLLHCYPFHRNAGFLAQAFPHVYLDVGLAINYLGAASTAVIAESMELAPFHKILYSSDAWGLPELHYLGARLWRRGTARVFQRWIDDDEWSLDDAVHVAALIGRHNALRVYGVP
jgi:predicted TIM-barrel fold metal-dependent hydrolase